MDRRFDLVAFDLYGTLLDIAGLERPIADILEGDGRALLTAWRRAQLEHIWQLNARGYYEPFDVATARALEAVAPHLDEITRNRLSALWLEVPPHADAQPTLAEIARTGSRSAVLSNGTAAMIKSALGAGRLSVDRIFSVDEVRAYKTDPRVYALLDTIAPLERTLFVSSNGWDVDGAKSCGRLVAFVDRGGAPPTQRPDLRVTSLSDLVRQ
jgi:2-haloacid dehalogenase